MGWSGLAQTGLILPQAGAWTRCDLPSSPMKCKKKKKNHLSSVA